MKLAVLYALGLAAAALAWPRCACAGEPTAFDLVKKGDKYVGDQAKDRVVQIRSEKSPASLAPDIWYVVYYDSSTTLKATEVKFADGHMIEVKHPLRLWEPVRGDDRQLESSKLKIDSDKALAIALKNPMLDHVDVKATQFWLDHGDTGPVWRIRFWAARRDKPGPTKEIGELFISSDAGEVIKNDLRPSRVY